MSAAYDKMWEAEQGLARDRERYAATERGVRDISLSQWDKEFAALERDIQARRERNRSFITERYALYDVASTAGITGAALLALVTAYELVAVSRERAFADVRGTVGFENGEIGELTQLRDDLVNLTREIPESFSTLAATATVGGQAGVAEEDIATYVEAVTKFATAENMNPDEVGDKLSKLRNILGLTADGYTVLANSISFAGSESAASSAEIIAVAEEIAPYAKQAGFGAEATIGLATAMASLAIPPERARSAFQELGRSIDIATTFGGEKLENYAAIAGMTADEFTQKWTTAPQEAFQAFIEGFQNVDNATVALRTLGLDGQRVTPVLLALSDRADLVAESFANAEKGVSNGFLDERFAVTVGTVAEQFQLLVNEIANLADAAGGPTLSALAGLINLARNILVVFTEIANSPIGQVFSPIVTGVIVLVGAFALLVGGAAAVGAAFLAIRTAAIGLDGAVPPLVAKLLNAAFGFTGVKISAREASVAISGAAAAAEGAAVGVGATATATRGLTWAIRGLLASTGIGLLVTLLGWLGGELLNVAIGEDQAADSVDAATSALEDQNGVVIESAEQLRDLVQASYDWINVNASLEESLYNLGQGIGENGASFSLYSEEGRKNIRLLEQVITAAAEVAGGEAFIVDGKGLLLRRAAFAFDYLKLKTVDVKRMRHAGFGVAHVPHFRRAALDGDGRFFILIGLAVDAPHHLDVIEVDQAR